ncbi:hypothetical protein Cyast_0116 [Cyanobacterium stanieri PCC 7202]|uniref:Uncharacterized protein n=1 Tax=Cyanobacterium stanieri (strain ATCC 29140 / PCC 7202) TaxID=292563 RepID=K9YGV3_CYASC|nr:hypothetical protein Cyast_0116 [Cyanobacterium stanieri PCC 7202]
MTLENNVKKYVENNVLESQTYKRLNIKAYNIYIKGKNKIS